MAVSHETMQQALASAQRARAQFAAFKERSEQEVGRLVQTVEVAGTAAALGLLAGRYGEGGHLNVVGVPVDLLVGLAALGTGIWLGSEPKNEEYAAHLHSISGGALALYLGRYSTEYGQNMAAKAHKSDDGRGARTTAATATPTTTAGWDYAGYGYPRALPAAMPTTIGASPLTPEEMTAMMQGAR